MRTFANAILLVALAVLSISLNAQNKKYTLSGQVFDSITGQPVSDPQISIAGTPYKTIGSEKGFYKIQKLIPGTNNLVVWADGYDSTIVRFEIRKNMRLNVKLMQILDTASLHIETNDAVVDSTVTQNTETVKLKATPKKEKQKKAKKKEPKKTKLTDKEQEELKVLIEDVIFAKAIFFERFKDKKKKVCVWGSFTIDTGYLYTFKAEFAKKDEKFELTWFEFKMKGRYASN